MSTSPSTFAIRAAKQRDAYIIRLEGELDAQGCPDLGAALEEAQRTRSGRIILDLEELTFIDSTGLETLLRASRHPALMGRLQLTRGKGFTADMFRLTGLDLTLPLTDPALCPAIRAARPARTRSRGHAGSTSG